MLTKLLVLTLSAPVCFTAIADPEKRIFTPENISGEIGFGTLSGKSKERVYDTDTGGKKISQLDWQYSHAAIIKGALDWDLMPWIAIGASGWTTLASRGGKMQDTDWLDDDQQGWTDRSKHPNSRLNFANEFDIHLTGWLLNKADYRIGVMAGYQESRYSFKSTGGSYHYSDIETGLPDIGSFPSDTTVIGYKQRFKVPYIGLTGHYRYQQFELEGAFKYSGWVRSSDSDQHYLAEKIFNDRFRRQNFFSLAGNVGYYLTPDTKVYVEGAWNRTTNKRGLLHLDDSDGSELTVDKSAGLENYNFITTVGLKYAF
ncbi:omptin family outer membrane protease [Erwinia sp. Eh17-17]|uniref:omptin family outer membrane protease n=1 Tax=Erwinia sp. Eh17-17 TaxID=3080330 RepID=UPI0032084B17